MSDLHNTITHVVTPTSATVVVARGRVATAYSPIVWLLHGGGGVLQLMLGACGSCKLATPQLMWERGGSPADVEMHRSPARGWSCCEARGSDAGAPKAHQRWYQRRRSLLEAGSRRKTADSAGGATIHDTCVVNGNIAVLATQCCRR